MKDAIPYGKHSITQEDIKCVVDVLESNYLTQGPTIERFEEEFANYVGAKYAIAVANGTAALHLCTLSLNVQPGQRIITSPITFAASANCIEYCGGTVEFADIDPKTYLIDLEYVKGLLKNAPRGTYSGIIPVDFAGRAVDLEKLRTIADQYDLWIIEDACHAPGGGFKASSGLKSNCGSGDFADLAIFSFHPVKHISAGEGGMITTNNKKLHDKLKLLRSHGITREENTFLNPKSFANGTDYVDSYPNWYMEMQTLGYNYRLTDFQAALGLSQLKKADFGLLKRLEIAKKYYRAFKNKDFIIRQSGVVEGHAYHLYIIEVEDRLGLYNFLRSHKIFTQVHYIPCHLMPYYRQKGWREGDFKYSEEYYKNCLSLPMFPSLKVAEQDKVISLICEYYG